MVAKRRVKKKRIKEDSFVTYSLKASRYTQEHFGQIMIGIVVIAVVGAFFIFTSRARHKALQDSERLLGVAMELYRQGDIEAARKSFTEIAEQYPRLRTGLIAFYFKGECHLKQSNFTEAWTAFDAYIRKSKKYPLFREAAIIGKALAAEGHKKYEDAALILRQLLEEMDKDDPRYKDVLFNAAVYYGKAGRADKAIEYFKEAAGVTSGRMRDQALVSLAILEQQ